MQEAEVPRSTEEGALYGCHNRFQLQRLGLIITVSPQMRFGLNISHKIT